METAIVTGHPDRPFVMGGLYHGEHTPPFASDGGLRTGTKTHSTTGGSADNYNELSFFDAKDAEEIKLQAERDQRLIVKNNRTTHVGYDELNSIGHDLTIEADVMMEIKVGASRVVLKPDSLTVESASILIHGNTTQLNPGNAAKAKSKGASVKPDTPKSNFVGPMPTTATAPAPISVPRSDTQTNGSKLGDLAKVVAKPFAVLIGGLLYSPSVADGTLPKLTVEDTGIVTDAAGNTVGYTGANSQLEPLSEQDEPNYRTYRANGGQAGINEWMVEKPLDVDSSSLSSDFFNNHASKKTKKYPLNNIQKKQVEKALAGKGTLPELSDLEKESLIQHYRQFEISNYSTKEEVAQALNWARIRFIKGEGPAPGRSNNPLYNFVKEYQKYKEQ